MSRSSIKKNLGYQMIYEVLLLLLPFLTSPYLSRVVGAEGLGVYSYSHSVAIYFVLFAMLGIKNYGNRAIARVRDEKEQLNSTFSSVLAVHLILAVTATIVYGLYIVVINGDKIYAVIQLPYVISAILDISWFYFGIEKFKLTSLTSTAVKLLEIIAIFSLVRTSSDLWKYCLIMSCGFFFTQFILWIPLHKYVTFVKPQRNEMRSHIKPMFVLFIPAIAISLYKYMDKIMIGSLSSKAQLGYYENAEKLNSIPSAIITAFGTVMMPKMSNLFAKDNIEKTTKYMDISIEGVMCLALAMAFGLSGIANTFSIIFWGDQFALSGTVIMYLAITIPFTAFANVIRTQYLIPKGLDKVYLKSVVFGAVINLIINYSLIPSYGAIGAAIGTICAEISVCVIQVFAIRNEIPIKTYIKKALPFFVPGITMFISVFEIGRLMGVHIYTLFVQLLVGSFTYLLVTGLYFYKTGKFKTILSMVKSHAKHKK